MSKVVFRDVSKTYKKGFTAKRVEAVKGLSFSLSGQGITGFIGPNGAGKTTSIKMLLGLIKPTKGRILINDTPPTEPGIRREISFISEQPYFYNHLSCLESIRFSSELYGIKVSDSKIEENLNRVGLKNKAYLRVRQLSKGMQQRLSMANALTSDTSLYVMDEPMSGLDPIGRKLFKQIFKELRERGKKIFFSTHILDDIEDLCNDIIVLSEGRLVESGNMETILEKGKKGTEIKVTGEIPDITATFPECSAAETRHKNWIISVPERESVGDVIRFLAEKGIYPESVIPKNRSLEELLYNNE